MPADSFVGIWKFIARRNICETPACVKPPPRYLSFWDNAVRLESEKIRLNKFESSVQFDKFEKRVVKMMQRYFLDSWLLPCSLRSHRTANPRPKMGFAIFRLYPPTTLRVANTESAAHLTDLC
jgi:hypothetical protein